MTRVPQSAHLREALDDLLKKYAAALRKATKYGQGRDVGHW
jgi:hypothetical protein